MPKSVRVGRVCIPATRSANEQIRRDAEVDGQRADMAEGKLAFAAQNHRAQGAMDAQQAREIAGRHAVLVQQVAEPVQSASGTAGRNFGAFAA